MASPRIIRKFYQPPVGVDYTLAGMNSSAAIASTMKNVEVQESLEGDIITNRRGWQPRLWFNDTSNSQDLIYNPQGGATMNTPLLAGEYNRTNTTTGVRVVRKFAMSDRLWVADERTVTFAYSGGASTVLLSIVPDAATNKIRCKIVEDGSEVLNFDCGNTWNHDLVRLSALKSAVEGLSGYTVTIDTGHEAFVDGTQAGVNTITVDDGTGGNHNIVVGEFIQILQTGGTYINMIVTKVTGTTISFAQLVSVTDNQRIYLHLEDFPAACLAQTVNADLKAANVGVSIYQWSGVYQPDETSGPFNNTYTTERHLERYRHPSYVNHSNNVYFGAQAENTSRSLIKFDGQNIYRSGQPQGPTPSLADGGSGSLSAGTYTYHTVCKQVDYQNNVVEGIRSNLATIAVSAGRKINVTVSSTPWGSLPFNWFLTKHARFNGNQTGVNTLIIKFTNDTQIPRLYDNIYFLDRSTGNYVVRQITAAKYGSGADLNITINGAAVDVNNNDPLSANLRIAIYRNAIGGTARYLVAEIPPDFGAANTVYVDDTDDTSLQLSSAWVEPELNEEHRQPSFRPHHLVAFQGSLVVGGTWEEPNTIRYSVPGFPEYFPATAAADIGRNTNDIITGLGISGEALIIFKENSTHRLSGQLLDPVTVQPGWRLDELEDSIGCVSHTTIANSDGVLFFLSRDNVFVVVDGTLGPRDPATGILTGLGRPIQAILTKKQSDVRKIYHFERACAVYDRVSNKYIVFLPAEDRDNSAGAFSRTVIDNSKTLVLDLARSVSPGAIIPGLAATLISDASVKPAWREWTNFPISGDAFISGQELWFLIRPEGPNPGDEFAYIVTQHDLGNEFDYFDAAEGIDWELSTGWETLENPGYAKKFLRVRPYATTDAVFTLGLKTNINFASDTHSDMSFVYTNGGSSHRKSKKLKATKANALRLKLTHNTGGEMVKLLGYEIEASQPERPRLGVDR